MSFDRRTIGNMLLWPRTSCGILNGMIGIWVEQRCTGHCKGDLIAGVPAGFDYDLRLILGGGVGICMSTSTVYSWWMTVISGMLTRVPATRVLGLRAVDCSAMPYLISARRGACYHLS